MMGEPTSRPMPIRGALLADWLTDPKNPFFAKAAVNRVWAAFFGRGFVQPVDDFRVSNPLPTSRCSTPWRRIS